MHRPVHQIACHDLRHHRAVLLVSQHGHDLGRNQLNHYRPQVFISSAVGLLHDKKKAVFLRQQQREYLLGEQHAEFLRVHVQVKPHAAEAQDHALQAVCSAVGQLIEQLLLVFEVVVEVALADIYLVRDHLQ